MTNTFHILARLPKEAEFQGGLVIARATGEFSRAHGS